MKTPLNTHFRLLIAAVLTALAFPVLAAVRAIPAEAAATMMTVNVNGTVTLGKKIVLVSPAAQIRDADNRIVLPAYLGGPYKVRVLLDSQGQLQRAWILTAEEAAQPAPKF